jgi:DNA-binding transcriptional MerR regulator
MDVEQAQRYTLAELSAEIGRRLADSGVSPVSGRVSALPDGRTLRYYTTIGLLDRPLEVRDRQARYGERHVQQALAIKSLQSEGLSLAAIQVALAGLDDRELAAVAAGATGERGSGRPRFWARVGTPVAQASGAVHAPAAPAAGTARTPAVQLAATTHTPAAPAAHTPAAPTLPAARTPAAPAGPDARPAPVPGAPGQGLPGPGGTPVSAAASFVEGTPRLHTTLPLAPGLALVLDGHWHSEALDVVRVAAEPLRQAWAALADASSHSDHSAGAPAPARNEQHEEQP